MPDPHEKSSTGAALLLQSFWVAARDVLWCWFSNQSLSWSGFTLGSARCVIEGTLMEEKKEGWKRRKMQLLSENPEGVVHRLKVTL